MRWWPNGKNEGDMRKVKTIMTYYKKKRNWNERCVITVITPYPPSPISKYIKWFWKKDGTTIRKNTWHMRFPPLLSFLKNLKQHLMKKSQKIRVWRNTMRSFVCKICADPTSNWELISCIYFRPKCVEYFNELFVVRRKEHRLHYL